MMEVMPWTKLLVPFVKTPTNVLKRVAHYTPLVGRALTAMPFTQGWFKEYTAVMRGTDESAKAVYRGREAIGATIGMSFMGMGAMGLSTGTGPTTREGRQAWKAANIPTHSFKVGNVWISNRWLGPIGILMSLYSDIGRIAHDPSQYENAGERVGALMSVTAGALFEQSWMQAVVGIAGTIADAQAGEADRIDPDLWAAQTARALIPYSAALKNFNETLTPGLREYESHTQKLIAQMVPFTKNYLGEEMPSMWSGEPMVSKGMSALNQGQPFGLVESQEDPLLHKLIDLGVNFPAEFSRKYKGVELNKAQKKALHIAFSKTNLRKDLEQKLLYDTHIHDANYEEWRNMPTPTPRKDAGWYGNITGQITAAMDQAYEQYVASDDPEAFALQQAVEQEKRNKHVARMNQYTELQEFNQQ
jgi:hypothetical protein